MGLFQKNKKPVCSICNTRESSKKLIDGYICKDCMAKCYPFVTVSWLQNTVDQIRFAISVVGTNRQLRQSYRPTKSIKNLISFDEKNRLWKVPNKDIIFRYEDVISYGLVDLHNNTTVTKARILSSGVQSTTFTGVLRVKVVTRHPMCSEVNINVNTIMRVNDAQQILSQFTLMEDILKSQSQISESSGAASVKEESTVSTVDELRKYKELFDEGIITEDEFNAKKKQLLGL